ncbi:hypothetical protein [Stygiolobus caldivivus]|nr:hypothetical protein [Stygiolobus caldivivus]
MKAQSEYVGFIFALIIVVALLIPLMFYLLDISSPSSKPINYQTVANQQVNGGTVIVYYNTSANPKYNQVIVYKSDPYFELTGVYYIYQGNIVNITKQIQAVNSQGRTVGSLPKAVIYNFTVPAEAFNYPLILQVSAYNSTTFVLLPPNETAIAS